MPDLGESSVWRQRPQHAQLLQWGLHRQVRIDQYMMNAPSQEGLGLFFAVGLVHRFDVFLRIRVIRPQPHVALENAVTAWEVESLYGIPLLEVRGECRKMVIIERRRFTGLFQRALHPAGGHPG